MLQRIRAYIEQYRLLPPVQAERLGQADQLGQTNRPRQTDRPEQAGRPEQTECLGQTDRPEQAGRPEQTECLGQTGRPEQADRPEQTECLGQTDRPAETGCPAYAAPSADYPRQVDYSNRAAHRAHPGPGSPEAPHTLQASPASRSGRPVVVGLSGGADSVALADILTRLGYPVVALHCNFHLRGEESMRDEAFARHFACQTLGIPFYKTDFDTAAYAARHHLSIETAARELRYAWFEEMRRRLDAEAIAVAHHRDDSAETLLMNLVRGSGIRGLTGIRARNGYVVRPLLDVSREEILAWLAGRGLAYVTDSTNLSDDYTRNFLRHRVIPLLEKINPAARSTLARSAAHLAEAETIYSSVIEQARVSAFLSAGQISIPALLAYPSPQTVLYELLRPYGFTRTVSREVFRALNGISGKQFFSSSYRLIKDRGRLLLDPLPQGRKAGKADTPLPVCHPESEPGFALPHPASSSAPQAFACSPCPSSVPQASSSSLGPPAAPPSAGPYEIGEKGSGPGCPVQLSCRKIVLAERETTFPGGKYPFDNDRATACFDYDKLRFPLYLRRWQPGDRFVPLGMKGRKKVSDYFTDRKFSRAEKENAWLLCSAQDIIWIVNERPDNRFRVREETKNMLMVKIFFQKDEEL